MPLAFCISSQAVCASWSSSLRDAWRAHAIGGLRPTPTSLGTLAAGGARGLYAPLAQAMARLKAVWRAGAAFASKVEKNVQGIDGLCVCREFLSLEEPFFLSLFYSPPPPPFSHMSHTRFSHISRVHPLFCAGGHLATARDGRTPGMGALQLGLGRQKERARIRCFFSSHSTRFSHMSEPILPISHLSIHFLWSTNRRLASCANLPALDSRAAAALPTLRIEWDAADAWAEVLFALEPTKGPKLASDVTVRIATDARTLTSCDELCLCPQTDERELSYSDACRQRIKAGSNCKVALPAKMGSNSASGVDDEFFVFTPSTGGSCRVGTTHRDTLLAVYGACGRVGAQQPVAFSNSEGHKADVEFACTAGKKYYVFWNAEYQPRAFSYTISEHGGKDSRSRMKGRRTDMWLHKLRGSRRGARR